MKNKVVSAVSVPFVLASSIMASALLQGCSGHPGAGHWQSKLDSNDSQYSVLEVEFDGKGTLYPNQLQASQEGKADLWCVWQAKSAITLEVQCGDGSEEKTNLKFELVVTGEKQEGAFAYTQADLLLDGKVVSSLTRKR
jgi:hypothetical protein